MMQDPMQSVTELLYTMFFLVLVNIHSHIWQNHAKSDLIS